MNSPSNYIAVLDRIHIFPGKFEMFSQSKAMNVYLRSSTKDIGLCAKLSSSANGKDFNSDSINVVNFIIGKINNNLIEAIILSSL